MRRKTSRAKIGDIIEIQTPRGLAYAQYSHHSPRMGELIRVLPGFHVSRPNSFEKIVNSKESFFVFYPLRAAVKQNLVSVVSEEQVPEAIQEFPLMRMPGLPNLDGKVSDWWLFNGKSERPLDSLTPELERLSVAELWGHPLLVQRIADGWSPSQFGKELKVGMQEEIESSLPRKRVHYYLHSISKEAAKEASRILKDQGFRVELKRAAEGSGWLILVSSFLDSPANLSEMTSRLERLAASLGINYDGEEIAL